MSRRAGGGHDHERVKVAGGLYSPDERVQAWCTGGQSVGLTGPVTGAGLARRVRLAPDGAPTFVPWRCGSRACRSRLPWTAARDAVGWSSPICG